MILEVFDFFRYHYPLLLTAWSSFLSNMPRLLHDVKPMTGNLWIYPRHVFETLSKDSDVSL